MKRGVNLLNQVKQERIGEVYPSQQYGEFKIVDYKGAFDITVEFSDTGYITKTNISNVRKGLVKDKLSPTVQGFGIVGEEQVRDQNGKIYETYRRWESMLKRVYGKGVKENPNNAYYDCTVSSDFQHYEDFKEWCINQTGFNVVGFALDKDILVKGNKVYGKDTCCFVPTEINGLFVKQHRQRGDYPIGVWERKDTQKFCADLCTGNKTRSRLGSFHTPEEAFYAYKEAKETYIKEVANKWKDQIDPRVYEALMNYEVNIDD